MVQESSIRDRPCRRILMGETCSVFADGSSLSLLPIEEDAHRINIKLAFGGFLWVP